MFGLPSPQTCLNNLAALHYGPFVELTDAPSMLALAAAAELWQLGLHGVAAYR
jgi:hypothetical protein